MSASSASACGVRRTSSRGTVEPILRVPPFAHAESAGFAARLALGDRPAQSIKRSFAAFNQPQAFAHYLARGTEAAGFHELVDQLHEMAAEVDGGVLGHAITISLYTRTAKRRLH